jgi:DNA repair photolyase
MFKGWEKKKILVNEEEVEAICPIIISASRATDIPAFYTEWFIEQLNKGYVEWVNPFNREFRQYISFEKVRLIVFWSKNPKPIIEYLGELDLRRINYYFQFTLNDYEEEGLEPNLPKLSERIETFKELSNRIGREKVIWRFDPLILTDKIDIPKLLEKIYNVGKEINKYTEKLVISFVDIERYRKVKNNLKKAGISSREFKEKDVEKIAEGIREINKEWKLEIATCAEIFDLLKYGIKHNKCIDDELIIRLFRNDKILMDFLKDRKNLKDKGQRKECGCIVSKDIGEYNTCRHLCIYCYANSSKKLVFRNLTKKFL